MTRILIVFFVGILLGWFLHDGVTGFTPQPLPAAIDGVKPSLRPKADPSPINRAVEPLTPSLQSSRQPPSNPPPTRSMRIKKVHRALETGKLKEAEQDLTDLIAQEPYHPEILMAKALWEWKRNHHEAALDALAEIFHQRQTHYSPEQLRQNIVQLAEHYLKPSPTSHQHHQERQAFLRQVIALLPGHRDFRYQLGRSLVATEAYAEAQQQLIYLQHDPHWRKQADKLRNAILRGQQLADGAIEIPLKKTAQGWLIEARIHRQRTARLLVDTGANITVFDKSALPTATYAVSSARPIEIHTANGISEAAIVTLRRLSIGRITDEPFDVAILGAGKLPPGIDGLLGTDWLGRFQFQIDQGNRLLRLEAAEDL